MMRGWTGVSIPDSHTLTPLRAPAVDGRREDIARIVELQVDQLTARVRVRGIEIELTERARELLANLGYDPTYGARPLKRVVQKQLVDKLALRILEGEFSEGDTVEVDAHDGDLSFAKARGRARKPEAERAAA
jgi:ATP-dependent Clp protease ATP-binding subunit ClpB